MSRQTGGEEHADVQDSYMTLQADSEYFLLPRDGSLQIRVDSTGRRNKGKSAADYIKLSL